MSVPLAVSDLHHVPPKPRGSGVGGDGEGSAAVQLHHDGGGALQRAVHHPSAAQPHGHQATAHVSWGQGGWTGRSCELGTGWGGQVGHVSWFQGG